MELLLFDWFQNNIFRHPFHPVTGETKAIIADEK